MMVCRLPVWFLLLLLGLPPTIRAEGADSAEPFSAEKIAFFENEVRPLLAENCLKCHGKDGSSKGGLRLTSHASLVKGGDTGPAISLESPAESLLLEAIRYESYEMPPSGKLAEEKIATLTRWVEMGAPMPQLMEEEEGATHGPPPVDEKAKQFWSFRPVQRPDVPQVNEVEWVANPIDAFVLHRLEQAGLQPAKRADKTALIRRAYYDLIGLPPTPQEVAEFLADESSSAYADMIDRLLDSPHYGERWARHWLDLVRYAETDSYERDGAKPFVWRYRDYVIRSLNADKPYDQFIREQLAGDEKRDPRREELIATGYYRLGIWQDEPVDPEQELFEDLDDLVRTTGEVFLGLTIGCARCHDHKIDPLPQADYYSFLAFFRNVRRYGVRSAESVAEASLRPIGTPDEVREHKALMDAYTQQFEANRTAIRTIESRLRKSLEGVENDEWKTEEARIDIARTRIGNLLTQEDFDKYVHLFEERKELRAARPPGLEQALVVTEHGRQSPATHVLVRGNAHVPGDEVPPAFPSVLSPPQADIPQLPDKVPSSGRRTALANWIASPENPLTSRVMVNRIWQHHFGRGIVRTSSDFGYQGSFPTHPQLLDWLADEFVNRGWRLKSLHKLIMMSNTYQMATDQNAEAYAQDPINDLFWRFDMRRLSAEEVRDSILAVNGSLNRERMFGPSIYTKIPAEVLAGQSRPGAGWGESADAERARRSIYIHVKRSLITPLLASFDGADTDFSCPVRFVTTQPTQALGMLNSDFINEQAEVFSENLRNVAGQDRTAQVELALRRVLQRPPTSAEVERGIRLLDDLQEQYRLSADEALRNFCVVALNLNEFFYLN